jgi:hypothetical protein
MAGYKEPGFADRQKAAREARKNILEKFQAQPGSHDPAVKQRQAEREAHVANREKARQARESEKDVRKRGEAEAAAIAAAQLTQDKEEAAAAEVALKSQRKAERDTRYAARKARKK